MSRHSRTKRQRRRICTEQEKAMNIEHPNGETPQTEALGPCHDLTVRFYPKVQQVELHYKPEEFRRWEFMVAILGMGVEAAQNCLKISRMQEMAVQQQAAMQEQALREALHRKGKIIQA
jgi:hypothetical protein